MIAWNLSIIAQQYLNYIADQISYVRFTTQENKMFFNGIIFK